MGETRRRIEMMTMTMTTTSEAMAMKMGKTTMRRTGEMTKRRRKMSRMTHNSNNSNTMGCELQPHLTMSHKAQGRRIGYNNDM